VANQVLLSDGMCDCCLREEYLPCVIPRSFHVQIDGWLLVDLAWPSECGDFIA
jgi:hypothetical protein